MEVVSDDDDDDDGSGNGILLKEVVSDGLSLSPSHKPLGEEAYTWGFFLFSQISSHIVFSPRCHRHSCSFLHTKGDTKPFYHPNGRRWKELPGGWDRREAVVNSDRLPTTTYHHFLVPTILSRLGLGDGGGRRKGLPLLRFYFSRQVLCLPLTLYPHPTGKTGWGQGFPIILGCLPAACPLLLPAPACFFLPAWPSNPCWVEGWDRLVDWFKHPLPPPPQTLPLITCLPNLPPPQ